MKVFFTVDESKNQSEVNMKRKFDQSWKLVFMISTLCLFMMASGCKSKSDRSKANEFENSAEICKDIDNYTKNKITSTPTLNGLDVFHSKRLKELAIVNDLIKTYDQAKQKRVVPETVNSNSKPQNSGTQPSTQLASGNSGAASVSTSTSTSTSASTSASATSNRDEASICKSVTQITPSGPPEHFNSLSSSADFDKGIAFYCRQKSTLEAQKCTYSGTKSEACGNLAAERPQWISESCQVMKEGLAKSVDVLAKESCKLVPGLLKMSKSNATDACGSALIGAVCTAHSKGVLDIAKYLDREAGGSSEEAQKAFTRNISGAFSSMILECLKGAAEKTMVDAIESGATTGAGWWAKQILDPEKVKEAVTGIKNPPQSMGGKVLKDAGLALCSAAGRAIADSINEAPSKTYQSYCGERTPKESQAWTASCFRTVADGCSSLAGDIDFAAIYKSAADKDPDGLLTKVALDTANGSVKAICGIGGTKSKVACGVISSATSQIIEAMRTGNNSWAECAGFAKSGGCLGEKFASWMTGVTTGAMDAPIGMPTVTNGHKRSVCCVCRRDYYQNDLGSDTLFRRDWILKGLASNANDVTDQSLCTQYNGPRSTTGNPTRDGYETYSVYSACSLYEIYDAPTCYIDPGPAPMPKQSFRANPMTKQKPWESTTKLEFGTVECLNGKC